MRLTSRSFDRKDILRIIRAIALFRPSMIALQAPLSFDDEVFIEKSLQRTLIVRGDAFLAFSTRALMCFVDATEFSNAR